jgi:CRISPR-associated protein Csc1
LVWPPGSPRPAYFYPQQKPNYEAELRVWNAVGVYVTPAAPVRLTFRQTQFNTIREGYALGGKARSIAYPDWGFLRVIAPGSTFRFYVLAQSPLVPQTYLRLGKFLSKARVTWQIADAASAGVGEFICVPLLNWRDLIAKPAVFDILPTALPTKLIGKACFRREAHLTAQFGEERVSFPRRMEYLPIWET